MVDPITKIKEPKGKLGILLPGMGAVATTFIAGVESLRRGIQEPVGTLTQMGTIRLGKRTENRSPTDQGFRSAGRSRRHRVRRLGHLRGQLLPGRDQGRCAPQGTPRPDQGFPRDDQADARRLRQTLRQEARRPQQEKGANWLDLAEQLKEDIERFKKENGVDRWSWSGAAAPRSSLKRVRLIRPSRHSKRP